MNKRMTVRYPSNWDKELLKIEARTGLSKSDIFRLGVRKYLDEK